MNDNAVNLNTLIKSANPAPAPVLINVEIPSKTIYTQGGSAMDGTKIETYVRFSALPDELRARVFTAVEALKAGML